MGDVQVASAGRGLSSASASSLLPQVTSGAANTKGSWTVLLADTVEPLIGMILNVGKTIGSTGTHVTDLVDIGIAPIAAGGGTEIVLVPNIYLGAQAGWPNIFLPIQVPAGYRISARFANQGAGATLRLGVVTIPAAGPIGPFEGCQEAVDIGTTTASTRGTTLGTPGGLNTEGAWTDLVASSTIAARWILLQPGPPNTATMLANSGVMDFAVGSAGNEKPIAENVPFNTDTAELLRAPLITLPCRIPAGSRISARCSCDTSVAAGGVPQASAILFG